MSKKNKSVFPDIMQAIGLILLAICLFFGLLFFNKSNITLSIPMALIILALLYGLVYLGVKLKSAETDQKTMQMWEAIVMIAGYGIAAIASLYFFIHFMNVEFNLKQEIQNNMANEIQDIQSLFTEYESYVEQRGLKYEVNLENAYIEREFSEYKLDPSKPLGPQQKVKVDALKQALTIRYNPLKSMAMTSLGDTKATFQNWNRLQIPFKLFALPDEKEDWRKQIISFSIATNSDKGKVFEFNFNNSGQLDLSDPRAFFGKTNWTMTIIVFLIIQLFILWPYLFTTRSASASIDGKSGQTSGGTL